ncbi:PAS domain-containing sensor histidine kinase [Deinococcus roseus]|uniref:histidine kinase n=1 Tax=Deinococcus roseus TaxID=392414 RepID=A0ABQ2DAA3_9DEIO|nr:ATP-binding protein [Deinococcus roseus]GGJ47514.1 hypothetical protein GCM10008938_36870 [Deinococcus roseus]
MTSGPLQRVDPMACQMLDALDEPAWLANREGTEFINNQLFLQMFPAHPGDPAELEDMLHPEDQDRIALFLSQHFQGDQPFKTAFRARGRTQQHLWYELKVHPLRHAGEVTGWLGRVKPLESSADHLAAILEHLPMAINVMDLSGEIIMMNSHQERASHTTREHYLGKTVQEVSPQYTEIFRQVIEEVHRTGKALAPREYLTAAGEWWRSFHFPVKAADGRWLGVGNASLNITEQKKAEQRALTQQRFLQQLTDEVPATIQIRNIQTGEVVFRNLYTTLVLGFTPEEFQAMTPEQQFTLVPPEDLPRIMGVTERIKNLQPGESIEDEYRLKHKDGHWRWLFGRSTVFTWDDQGQALESLTVGLDITRRKQTELELEASEKRLQHLLEGHRRFVSDASHEIKTPIAGIQGNLEVLLRYADIPEEEKREIIQDCHREAARLGRLVQDLLHLARSGSGMLMVQDEVRLDQLVQDTLRDFESIRGQRELQLGDVPECVVEGDPDRLKQLLVILVGNALKYTPDGGKVTVDLQDHDRWVLLHVTDTGIGIAEKDLHRVFERYFRADHSALGKDPGGTGLGLPIARWIVQEHGGEIHLESDLGKGTTVVVKLPAPAITPH